MSCRSQLTVLTENRAKPGLLPEHGLSILIEHQHHRILLDTGQSGAFLINAAKMDISIMGIHALVLSHGHYDHGGGIDALLDITGNIPVHAAPGFDRPRYSLHPGAEPKYIGLSPNIIGRLKNMPDGKCNISPEPSTVAPGLHLTGRIPRVTAYEDAGGPFYYDRDGHEPDDIPDDQALWLETEKGLVVLTGCAHAGLVNTLSYIMTLSGREDIIGIIGGFHLVHAGPERIEQTVKALQPLPLHWLAPCHCTGATATGRLHHLFTDRCLDVRAGTVIAL